MKLSLEDLTILRNALDQTQFPKDGRRKAHLSIYNRIKKLEAELLIKASVPDYRKGKLDHYVAPYGGGDDGLDS